MSSYRYLDGISVLFVTTVLLSNIASSAKIVDLGWSLFGLPLVFDAGTLIFPISYIFGDVLTEVYGYARSRRVIWQGFGCAALMSLYLAFVAWLPGESQWQQYAGDSAFASVLGGVSSGGIIVASLAAYLLGELSNAAVLAKIKIAMDGRLLFVRTIASTLVGQGIDTVLFIVIACALGVFPWAIALSLIVANYVFKVGIEVLMTPVTYRIVHYLKGAEIEDYYDTDTDFSFWKVS